MNLEASPISNHTNCASRGRAIISTRKPRTCNLTIIHRTGLSTLALIDIIHSISFGITIGATLSIAFPFWLVAILIVIIFLVSPATDYHILSLREEKSVLVKANKPLWNVGSSFSIKKTMKSLPKVQIDDDLDMIDEDSPLTEEDLKKP
ncbi:hypothetical protein Syun_003965 [Stephania yunnanensis]|uniref:Uncharacterized protein n=1 Tax=Stephania yunnanensis TaxID=152371 RepID=A0AAP0L245_9MAGN